MTSKLVVNTIESDTGISSVSFASSISMSSTSKFFFSAAGIDIGADTNINRPASGVLGFNINSAEKFRIDSSGHIKAVGVCTATHFYGDGSNLTGLTVPGGATNLDLLDSSGTGNGRIRLGASQDLQIYHDGSHSWFKNTTGRLLLQTDGDQIQLRGNTIVAFNGAASTEYLRITSTGQFIVGTNPSVGSGNIVHIEAPTSFNSGETIVNIKGNNATAGPRLLLHNNNTGASAHGEILGVDAGGQSTSSIRFYNTDQSNNYGEIAFGTRNVSNAPPADRMRIDKDGYVTKPHTPAFFATHTGAGNNVIGTLTYNTSGNGYYNNGGHLNVSTGRFHAPVSGIYTFHFHGFFQSGYADNYYEVVMKRSNSNGGGVLSLCRQYGYRHMDPSNQYGPSISMHCTCYLTAGQRVEVSTGNLPFHGSNGYYFGGHLVG